MRLWPLLVAIGCQQDAGPELFTAETFEPPAPSVDEPCGDDSLWRTQDVPTDNGLADLYYDGEDLWFAGGQGLILHWDGETWTDWSQPTGDLMAIHGTGPNDIWVVGREGFAAHFDGAGWTEIDTQTTEILVDVWAARADRVWMIGEEGVRLYDGAMVTVEEAWPDGPMNKLWSAGPDDLWIVANQETFHWDGVRFSTRTVEKSGRLTAVYGFGPGEVFALGHSESERPGFAKNDVDRWLFGAAPRRAFFFSLWGRNSSELWAGSSETSIFFWNGARWCREYSGGAGAITTFEHGDGFDVWAAGSISGEMGATRPVLLRR